MGGGKLRPCWHAAYLDLKNPFMASSVSSRQFFAVCNHDAQKNENCTNTEMWRRGTKELDHVRKKSFESSLLSSDLNALN